MSWKNILKEASRLERELAREYAPREMEEGKFEAEGLKEDRELKEEQIPVAEDFFDSYADDCKKLLNLLKELNSGGRFERLDFSGLPILEDLLKTIMTYETKLDDLYGYELEYLTDTASSLMEAMGGLLLNIPQRFLGSLKDSNVMNFISKFGRGKYSTSDMKFFLQPRIKTLKNIISLGQDYRDRRRAYPTRITPLK